MACECRVYQSEGICWHTGKRQAELPAWAHRMQRDRDLEHAFLAYATELAGKLGVPPDGAFRRLVFHRTDGAGASNYGDTAFLSDDRDLPAEAVDEAGDGGVYCMFQAEKLELGLGDATYHHLAAAAAHFAAAHYQLRLLASVDFE